MMVRTNVLRGAIATSIVAIVAAALGCSRDEGPSSKSGASKAPDGSTGASLAVVDDVLAPHFRNAYRDGDVRFAGLPTEAGLERASEDGVTVVVSLLSEPENDGLGFDEAATVDSLGMEFVHLPVAGGGITTDIVDQFAEVMESTPGGLLVHCGSSNRVGALWAAYQGLHAGATPEQALARGRAAGLKSGKLAEAVEALFAEE